MGVMASQITSLMIVYSTVYSGADQRKHQSSVSLAFVRRIHRVPGEFPAQMASYAEKVPFDYVTMIRQSVRFPRERISNTRHETIRFPELANI